MHSVFPGDLFDLERGRLVCADPGDVLQIDALIADDLPSVAIIDPPNGQIGRDLLVYLAILGIPRIICWRADLYPGTVSLYRKGHWICWDPDLAQAGRTDPSYSVCLLAYHYGGVGPRPLILRSPGTGPGPRLAPGFQVHKSILAGHPDYKRGQSALICYDGSGGASACAARSLGLVPLVIDPDPAVCSGILTTLGRFDMTGDIPG